jgi:hypothetical protein
MRPGPPAGLLYRLAYLCLISIEGRVALVLMSLPDSDDGAPGPSHLGTGEWNHQPIRVEYPRRVPQVSILRPGKARLPTTLVPQLRFLLQVISLSRRTMDSVTGRSLNSRHQPRT